MSTIVIENLEAGIPGKKILKGLNLSFDSTDTIAVLGPNGHGKSTLLGVLMGNPRYIVYGGKVTIDGEDLLSLTPDQRSKKGLFLAMQTPSEIPGLNSADFYKAAMNAHREKPLTFLETYRLLQDAYREIGIPFEMSKRNLNEGFSGGEKKRNEILQMILLNPKFAFLDEIDSGLDVDALNVVSAAINRQKEKGTGFLIVSHYDRLFEMVKPNKTAVIVDGRVAVQGGPELAKRIDTQGYEWIKDELGIEIEKSDERKMNSVSIGTCAVKVDANGR